jgi:hypothetical protein
MDLGEICWGGIDWVGPAQDRDRWRVLVNALMNYRVASQLMVSRAGPAPFILMSPCIMLNLRRRHLQILSNNFYKINSCIVGFQVATPAVMNTTSSGV